MNISYYIAKRIAFNKNATFSRLIIRIATGAVALSVTIMVIATCFVAGFKHTISEKIFGFWGDINVMHIASNRDFESTPFDRMADEGFYYNLKDLVVEDQVNRKIFGIEAGFLPAKTIKGKIKHIQSFANKPGIIQNKQQIEGIVLKGIDTDFYWENQKRFLIKGEALRITDSAKSNNIIISESTARRLKLDLKDKLKVFFVKDGNQRARQFKVSGIYKTGIEEHDKKIALVDIKHIQKLNNWEAGDISGLEIFLEKGSDLNLMKSEIHYEHIPRDLYAQSIRDKYPNLFGWLDLQDLNIWGILVIMSIVAIISMITALLILILERTNMIGVLKALGQTDWAVRKIFLYHAITIIGVGILIGNIIGIGICLLQQQFEIISLDETAYYVSVVPVYFNYWSIFLINIITLITTLLMLIIPTYLIVNIEPVKAIRFK